MPQTNKSREKTASSDRFSVDAEDVARFSALSDRWWDESGPFAPLHRLNPCRIGYLRERIADHFSREGLAGLTLLDVGCGGGLIAEPMARLGAMVTGIDASGENIAAAIEHADATGLDIAYRAVTAEELQAEGATFDVVLALEIVEHVADAGRFLETLSRLVAPGGLLILSTLNRTAKSLLLAKIGAEYVLRWVPAETHDWSQFKRPSELAGPLQAAGMRLTDVTGMVFSPLKRAWRLVPKDVDINYLATFAR